MSKQLEKIVKNTSKVRALRQTASTTYTGLRAMQDTLEDSMAELLKQNHRLSPKLGLYAKLTYEKKGAQGMPYKQVIADFIRKNPRAKTQFEKIISRYERKIVEKVDYGKR